MKIVNYDNLETAKEMIKVALEKKVDKEDGKSLSTNDYTNEEKTKLAGIEEEANKTIVDSELSLESTNPVENKIIKEALDTKADKVAVDEALETKADKIAVEEALGTKADKQEVIEALDTKVDKEPGKGLSTNDFTTEEKEKLSKLDINSNENVIEVIKQNGQALEITDKSVDIVTITEDEVDNKIEEAVKNVEVDLTDYAKRTDIPKNVSDLFNDLAYISSSEEKDPTVPAYIKAITEAQIAKWDSGTGSGSGSSNVIVSPTEPTTGEEVWVQTCRNLFIPSITKKGYYIKASGSLVYNADDRYFINNYMEIEPDTVYTAGETVNSFGGYHVWYDADKNFISSFNQPNGFSVTVTSPSNAKYIRFSLYNDTSTSGHSLGSDLDSFQFVKGTTVPEYTANFKGSKIYVNDNAGSYEEIYDSEAIPEIEQYVLPPATASTLGGIKVGDNLTIDADGTLHAQSGGSTTVTNGEPNELITVGLNGIVDVTSTTQWQQIQIPLDIVTEQQGDSFKLADGGVIIPKGVNKIMVSGQLMNQNNTEHLGFYIRKNGTAICNNYAIPNGDVMFAIVIPPKLVDVTEGDVIDIAIYLTNANVTKKVRGYEGRGTFLTVEKVNEMSVIGTEQNNGTYMWIHNSAAINLEANAYYKLGFDKLIADTSNGKLIHEDGGIRIGKGVKQILVISKWNTWTTTCNKYINLVKNGTSIESASFNKGVWTANIVSYVDVTEGDYIEIQAYHDHTSSMSIASNNQQTGLKVIVLGETTNVEITGDVTTNGNINAVGETNEIFRAGLSAAHSVTLTKAWEKHVVLFNVEASKIGENLSLTSEGRIKIGSGISKIAIKGSLLVCGSAICTLDARLCVLRDGANVSSTGFYTHLDKAKDYRSSVMMNPIVDVQENDEVYIVVTSDTANTLTIANDAFLLVEKINDTNVIAGSGGSAVEDTGWVDATLTEDFKLYNDTSKCHYRKVGNQVSIQFVLSPAKADNVLNSATETTAFNLPEKFRPPISLNTVCQGSGTNIFLVGVNTSGNVNIYRYRNSSTYSSTPPSTTAWLPFHIVYYTDDEVGGVGVGGSTEEDSGWLDGETVTGSWVNFRYRKIGNRVRFEGRAGSLTPSTSEILLGTIPVEYAPIKTIFTIGYGAGTQLGRFNINNAGEVKLSMAWDILTAQQVTVTNWYHFYFDYWLD